MNYKKHLEDQFLFRDLDERGYLLYNQMAHVFMYSDHVNSLCHKVASYVDNTLTVHDELLLLQHMPDAIDEVIKDIARQCAEMDYTNTEEFNKEVVEVCNRLYSISKLKTKKNLK